MDPTQWHASHIQSYIRLVRFLIESGTASRRTGGSVTGLWAAQKLPPAMSLFALALPMCSLACTNHA